MADERRPKPGHEERDSGEKEKLGPYLLHEHVPQERYDQGELYVATHATRRTRTLVLKPGAQAPEDAEMLKEWEARLVSSASPQYLALEVQSTRCARTPKRPSMEEMMSTFEQMRVAMERMARLYLTDEARSAWRRPSLVLASVAAVCALVFAGVRLASPAAGSNAGAQATQGASSLQPLLEEVEANTSIQWREDPQPEELFISARPIPFAPLKGQKLPPCTPRSQVELVGACWGLLKAEAPCPKDTYEHEGKCYIPVISPEGPSQAGDK